MPSLCRSTFEYIYQFQKNSGNNTLEDKWRMWVPIIQLIHSLKQVEYHINWASVRPGFSQFLLQRQFNPLKRSRSQSANDSQLVCLSVLAYSFHSLLALSEILFSGGLRVKDNRHNFSWPPLRPISKRASVLLDDLQDYSVCRYLSRWRSIQSIGRMILPEESRTARIGRLTIECSVEVNYFLSWELYKTKIYSLGRRWSFVS